MANEIFSKSLVSENLKEETRKIKSAGIDLIGKAVDFGTGIPMYEIVSQGVLAIRDFRVMKMIAHFFEEFDELSWDEKTEFSYRISNDPNFEDFTEKVLFYLESMQKKEKAKMMGALAKALALDKISMSQFDYCLHVLHFSNYYDLLRFKGVVSGIYDRYSGGENEFISFEPFKGYVSRLRSLSIERRNLSSEEKSTLVSAGLFTSRLKTPRVRERYKQNTNLEEVFNNFSEEYSITESGLIIFWFCLKNESL